MKTALVTGGSRGIGRATVSEFAAAGYLVAFTYRENRDAAESLTRCLSERGYRTLALQADVRDFERAKDVVNEVQGTLGPLDVLINNAGIRRDKALFSMEPAMWLGDRHEPQRYIQLLASGDPGHGAAWGHNTQCDQC